MLKLDFFLVSEKGGFFALGNGDLVCVKICNK